VKKKGRISGTVGEMAELDESLMIKLAERQYVGSIIKEPQNLAK
jgi:hypothetical protein